MREFPISYSEEKHKAALDSFLLLLSQIVLPREFNEYKQMSKGELKMFLNKCKQKLGEKTNDKPDRINEDTIRFYNELIPALELLIEFTPDDFNYGLKNQKFDRRKGSKDPGRIMAGIE